MLTVPLQVQPHQVVYVEAETDVGDSAAGVGLAAETEDQSENAAKYNSPCNFN